MPGLIKFFGDCEKFSNKFMRAFKGTHFNINNESDIAFPYLFNYKKGKEEYTQEIVTGIINSYLGITPDGLPGE